MKLSTQKSNKEITKEWDFLANERHDLIENGFDPSFEHVLAPAILNYLKYTDNSRVLDIGCGTGDLTVRIAKKSEHTIAIEPSAKSLKLARSACKSLNVEFYNGVFEEFSESNINSKPSTIVMAMTLMCVVDIKAFLTNLGNVSSAGTSVIITITHPCFWPKYWGYDSEEWFDYSKEIFIEAPFSTSKKTSEFITTHIHRPVEQYIAEFTKAGFIIENYNELRPSIDVETFFPLPWEYPRFLLFKLKKV